MLHGPPKCEMSQTQATKCVSTGATPALQRYCVTGSGRTELVLPIIWIPAVDWEVRQLTFAGSCETNICTRHRIGNTVVESNVPFPTHFNSPGSSSTISDITTQTIQHNSAQRASVRSPGFSPNGFIPLSPSAQNRV